MASSDTPAHSNKRDEQVPTGLLPVNDSNVETVKSNTTPPSSESANKRKRESPANNDNTYQETKPAKETTPTVADTKQPGEKHVADVETTVVKEVEMKDAESVEIEMQDAEVAHNNETASDSNASEGCKEDEGKVERSENSNNDEGNGSGQDVLGEVATLLKQVEESETKAKLQVEVKVKKMDDGGDVKENGQVNEEEQNRRSG